MTKNGKNLARRATNLLVLFVIILGAVVPSFAATTQRRRSTRRRAPVRRVTTPPARYYTVPADTVIRVRVDTELSSKTARTGDRFSATVTEPVYGGGSGVDVVPTGSKVWGRVTSVRRSGRRTPGSITVSFNQVELPNGARHAINGSLSSLQTDDVNADNERSEEHTSELQSRQYLVCRLLLE